MLGSLTECLKLTTFHVLFLVLLSCYCCLQAELEIRSLHFTTAGAKGTKLFKFSVGQVLSLPRNNTWKMCWWIPPPPPSPPQLIELQELEYLSEVNWEFIIGADSSTIRRSSSKGRKKKKEKACFYVSKRKGLILLLTRPKKMRMVLDFASLFLIAN